MSEKNNDDSSSSEDEIFKDALREATDHQFFNENNFSNKSSKHLDTSKTVQNQKTLGENKDTVTLKSLRKTLEEDDKFENFGVSPSFKNYVAKKLDEILEKSIRLKNKDTTCTNDKKRTNIGVKLLNTSVEFLTTEEEVEKLSQPKKRRKSQEIADEKKDLLKCKEVAVDSEWVLAKIDTKAWTSKRKDVEFKYKKLKTGVLVEQT